MKGIAASEGLAIGKVYVHVVDELNVKKNIVKDQEAEIKKFRSLIEKNISNLETIKKETTKKMGEEKGEVFQAHIEILKDPEVIEGIETIIDEGYNVEYAIDQVFNQYIQIFENMTDEYLKARSADLRDLRKRLLGGHTKGLESINEEVIIIAEDLTPSDTAALNKKYVKGIITAIGSRTSHSAIMARSMEIPAILGVKEILNVVKSGDQVILDAMDGEVYHNPDMSLIHAFKEKILSYEKEQDLIKSYYGKPSITKDNHSVELAANMGSLNDIKGVIKNDAEGIGLFRTEFIYMESEKMPTEEVQFEIYKEVLEKMENKPVVIRTLDIGGDKELDYLDLPKELNPFLGYRAIRLCLDRVELFKVQLRALLRASTYGNLKIMFPMIATINELKQVRTILDTVKKDLINEGYEVSDKLEVGMMVEVPSVAVLADQFVKYVDFFSLGTNDLIQYTFAADRMSQSVSYLYQPYNPSLLRLIKNVIDAAHKEDKWVGMCGEMAGDPIGIRLLLGLGLDEFSMSATSILKARKVISEEKVSNLKLLADQALNRENHHQVKKLVEDYIDKNSKKR